MKGYGQVEWASIFLGFCFSTWRNLNESYTLGLSLPAFFPGGELREAAEHALLSDFLPLSLGVCLSAGNVCSQLLPQTLRGTGCSMSDSGGGARIFFFNKAEI